MVSSRVKTDRHGHRDTAEKGSYIEIENSRERESYIEAGRARDQERSEILLGRG